MRHAFSSLERSTVIRTHSRLFLGALACCLAACTERPADILLFNGTGTSPNDVVAIEHLLDDADLPYRTVGSSQLNAMSESQLRAYRLLIMPGGNFEQMGNSLTPPTAETIRTAVQGGLNYLGLCAGAFIAGDSPYNGFNLTSGARFHFYVLENAGVHKAGVRLTIAPGDTATHYWEDGPELTGWGNAVAKYPDGTPAVVEGRQGDGWVILTGIHPEAPESWRRDVNITPARTDNAWAVALIRAALNRIQLEHF